MKLTTTARRTRRNPFVFVVFVVPLWQINSMSNQKPPPITDSPWLWFALFSAVGLTTLLATGGKFKRRQAGIERRDQARIAVAEGTVEVVNEATHSDAHAHTARSGGRS